MDDDIFDILDNVSIANISTSKNRISLKEFLTTYVEVSREGGNSVDVANKLGISPQGVRQRVTKLVKKGINLPKLGNICRKAFAANQENKND